MENSSTPQSKTQDFVPFGFNYVFSLQAVLNASNKLSAVLYASMSQKNILKNAALSLGLN